MLLPQAQILPAHTADEIFAVYSPPNVLLNLACVYASRDWMLKQHNIAKATIQSTTTFRLMHAQKQTNTRRRDLGMINTIFLAIGCFPYKYKIKDTVLKSRFDWHVMLYQNNASRIVYPSSLILLLSASGLKFETFCKILFEHERCKKPMLLLRNKVSVLCYANCNSST